MMEDEDGMMIKEADTKRKRDEVAWGRRKRRKEDDVRPEKGEHSPTIFQRTQNLDGFNSEDWDVFQQEEDEW